MRPVTSHTLLPPVTRSCLSIWPTASLPQDTQAGWEGWLSAPRRLTPRIVPSSPITVAIEDDAGLPVAYGVIADISGNGAVRLDRRHPGRRHDTLLPHQLRSAAGRPPRRRRRRLERGRGRRLRRSAARAAPESSGWARRRACRERLRELAGRAVQPPETRAVPVPGPLEGGAARPRRLSRRRPRSLHLDLAAAAALGRLRLRGAVLLHPLQLPLAHQDHALEHLAAGSGGRARGRCRPPRGSRTPCSRASSMPPDPLLPPLTTPPWLRSRRAAAGRRRRRSPPAARPACAAARGAGADCPPARPARHPCANTWMRSFSANGSRR